MRFLSGAILVVLAAMPSAVALAQGHGGSANSVGSQSSSPAGGGGGKSGGAGGGSTPVTAPVVISDAPLDNGTYWDDTAATDNVSSPTFFGYATLFAGRPIRVRVVKMLTDTASSGWVKVDSTSCALFGVEFTSLTGIAQGGNASPTVVPTRWRIIRKHGMCVAEYRWRFGDAPGDQMLSARGIAIDTSYHPCGEVRPILEISRRVVADSLQARSDSFRVAAAESASFQPPDSLKEAMLLVWNKDLQARLNSAKTKVDTSRVVDSMWAQWEQMRSQPVLELDSAWTARQQELLIVDREEAVTYERRSAHNAYGGCMAVAKAGQGAYKEYHAFATLLPAIAVGGGLAGPWSVNHFRGMVGVEFPFITQLPLLPMLRTYPGIFSRVRMVVATSTNPTGSLFGHDLLIGVNVASIFDPAASGSPLQLALGARAGLSKGTSGGVFIMAYLNASAVLNSFAGALGL